jgi:hypothetical protein
MEEINDTEEDSGDRDPETADNCNAASGESPCAAAKSEIAEQNGPGEALSGACYDVRQMDKQNEQKEHAPQKGRGQLHVALQGEADGRCHQGNSYEVGQEQLSGYPRGNHLHDAPGRHQVLHTEGCQSPSYKCGANGGEFGGAER